MKQLLSCTLLFCSLAAAAQKEFFKSPQTFNLKENGSFYASITLQNGLLLFNAPDYHLYAYDAQNLKLKWDHNLGWQSNSAPYFSGGHIWANTKVDEAVQLDTATGSVVKELPFSIYSQPVLKNGLLYSTGIYDGGCLYAYDLKGDSIAWKRFLAHGCSETPYYFPDKIVANAEGHYWLEVDYSGRLKDPACETVEYRFPSELPCARRFVALTHDQKEIAGALAEDLLQESDDRPEVVTAKQHSFILSIGRLTILGNQLRKKSGLDLSALSDSVELEDYGLTRILKADDENLWILYSQRLFVYNLHRKKATKMIDLQAWNPHAALADGNRLWLISRKDGRLYGLTLE